MDKIERKKVFGFLIIIIMFLVSHIIYRRYKMRDSSFTFAVYHGFEGSAWARHQKIIFYTRYGNKVKTKIDYVEGLKKGDTVWIKYSNEDSTVAEIIDKDYKKYIGNK